MPCDLCTDPDGDACFPTYGAGATYAMQGYTPDPDCEGMGIWWCPKCGDGKPEIHVETTNTTTTIQCLEP